MFGLFDIFAPVNHTAADYPIQFVSQGGKSPLEREKMLNVTSNKSSDSQNTKDSGKTLQQLLDQYCPKFRANYTVKLSPWLFNGHLQTIYALFADNTKIPIHYQRHYITYPDQGRGAVDYVDIELSKKEQSLIGNKTTSDDAEAEAKELRTLIKDIYKGEENVGSWKYDEDGEIEEMGLPARTRFANPSPIPNTPAFLKTPTLDQIASNDKPLILFLHGLSGGSQETYVKLLIKKLVQVNDSQFDIMVLNSRGCSHNVVKTPRLYNGLWTDDVRYLINEKILPLNKNKEIYMVGFSLGATVLSNFLAQESASNPKILNNLKLGIVISTPWDLISSSTHLHSSYIGKEIYSPAMTKGLCRLLKNNYKQLQKDEFIDTELLHDLCANDAADGNDLKRPRRTIKYLPEFDNAFTSRMFGFNNYEEYYKFASPTLRLHKVRVPMLLISALDDPIVGPHVPSLQVKQNPFLHMLTTKYGGHVCWFERLGDQWYNEPLAQLVGAMHKEQGKDGTVIVPGGKASLPRDPFIDGDRVVMPGSYSDVLSKIGNEA